jgi:hypothetical protein
MIKNLVGSCDGDALAGTRLHQPTEVRTARRKVRKWNLMLLGAVSLLASDLAPSPDGALAMGMPPRPALQPTYGTLCPIGVSVPALPNQAVIFTDKDGFVDKDGHARCVILDFGLYPEWKNLRIPDDWMSSIQVGSNVRVRLFKDSVYRGGAPLTICGSGSSPSQCAGTDTPSNLVVVTSDIFNLVKNGFNDTVSSMRVERLADNPQCGDVRNGEIALFTRDHWHGDCIVHPQRLSSGPNDLESPEWMGIADNALSSMIIKGLNQACTLKTFSDAHYYGNPHRFHTDVGNVDAGTSSIQMCATN